MSVESMTLEQDTAGQHLQASTEVPLLLQLPLDLLFSITDLLEPHDTMCLSLCNRSLYSSLDTATYKSLHLNDKPDLRKMEFLRRLARDSPDQFPCSVCYRLHDSARVGPFASITHRHSLVRKVHLHTRAFPELHHTFGGSYYNLNAGQLRLAMERHRFGSGFGIALGLLSASEVIESRIPNETFDRLLSVEAQIINDRFYLRVQCVIVASLRYFRRIAGDRRVDICPHNPAWNDQTAELVKCKINHADQNRNCPTCRPILRCMICHVQFHIHTRTTTKSRKALIVTRLLDLGRGHGQWDWFLEHRDLSGWTNCIEPVPAKDSSRWASFDGENHPNLWELTKRNLSILCDQSYRTDFTRVRQDPWSEDNPKYLDRWLHQENNVIDQNWTTLRPDASEAEPSMWQRIKARYLHFGTSSLSHTR